LFNFIEKRKQLEEREKEEELAKQRKKQEEVGGKLVKNQTPAKSSGEEILEGLYDFYLGDDDAPKPMTTEATEPTAPAATISSFFKPIAKKESKTNTDSVLAKSFKGSRDNFVKTTLKSDKKKRFKSFKASKEYRR
jgi:hypothetical protein